MEDHYKKERCLYKKIRPANRQSGKQVGWLREPALQ